MIRPTDEARLSNSSPEAAGPCARGDCGTSPPAVEGSSVEDCAGEQAAGEPCTPPGGRLAECPPGADVPTATAAALQASYGAPFWYSYAANTLMMMAVSMLFRYSDFVHLLGGTELHLGWIVGVGMVGSLSMRLFQGVGIDRYGSKQVWRISAVVFILSLLGHLWITRVDGPMIYLLRIAFNTSVAGVFGASITFISRRAPVVRVAEVIGTLGTSGFIGMVTGTTLGDWLCHSHRPERWEIDRLFLVAAGLAAVALGFAIMATRGQRPVARRRDPPWLWLRVLFRYHPGYVLLMGVATGFGIGLPTVFLRPFVAELGIAGIATFFWIYAPTAFITRLCIRRVPEKLGIRPTILLGISSLAVSMLFYLVVQERWQLAIPAVFTGIAHAMLFPCVVGGGSTAFPARYRGLGTTLMLATVDLGNLIGAPAVGGMVHFCQRAGLPPYPTMFVAVAVLLFGLVALYGVATRREKPRGLQHRPIKRKRRRRPARSTGSRPLQDTAG